MTSPLTYQHWQRWLLRLTHAVSEHLEQESFLATRNAIIFLRGLVSVYPSEFRMANHLSNRVEKLSKTSKFEDLKVLANSYYSRLVHLVRLVKHYFFKYVSGGSRIFRCSHVFGISIFQVSRLSWFYLLV